MEFTNVNLSREERVMQNLHRLFSQYGYSRYRMGKFEAYDMYLENKAFLNDEKIITFTDGSGKLMALKPDITMSIIKNLPKEVKTRKVYYSENVFRMNSTDNEYHEIAQMGIEYIGATGCYAEAEVVLLAAQSLSAISDEYLLNISHMGFLGSVFEELNLKSSLRLKIKQAFRAKNAHTLNQLITEADIDSEMAQILIETQSMSGPFVETLQKAKEICKTAQMVTACSELEDLYNTLEDTGVQQNLRLDFSVLNDDDYYNGIELKGFVRGVPRAVLAGGRYDKLMRRFDKPQCAVGFALYLGELSRMLAEKNEFDVKSLLIYKQEQDPKMVMKAVCHLAKQGTVRAENQVPQGYKAENVYVLENDGTVREATQC